MLAPLILLFFGYMVYRSAKIIVFLLAPSNVLEGNSKTKMLRNFSADCLLFFFAWFLVFINSSRLPTHIGAGTHAGGMLGAVMVFSVVIVLLHLLFNLIPDDFHRFYLKLFFWIISLTAYASIFSNFLTNDILLIFLVLLAIFLGVAYYIYKKINIDLI